MAQANINIRMDADLKRDFERLCKDVGISLTTVITNLARQSVRDSKIPAELERDPFFSEANIAYLKDGIAELDAGKGICVTGEEMEYVFSAPNDEETAKRLSDLRVSKGLPRSVAKTGSSPTKKGCDAK